MGRNRGQGQQGQGKKGGGEKVKVRSHKPWRWPRNRERNLVTEANRAERKFQKLMLRGRAGKPGGIIVGSKREKVLCEHIMRLGAEAKTYPNWL